MVSFTVSMLITLSFRVMFSWLLLRQTSWTPDLFFYQIRLLAFFVAITHYWVWTDLFHSPDCCLLSCWVKFHDSCWYDLWQVGEMPKLYKIHLHHNGRKWRKLHRSSQILHLTESNFFSKWRLYSMIVKGGRREAVAESEAVKQYSNHGTR